MSQPSLPLRETQLLATLSRIASERASAEERVAQTYRAATSKLDREHAAERLRLDTERDQRVQRAESLREQTKNAIKTRYETEKQRLKSAYENDTRSNETAYRQGIAKSQKSHDESRWQTLAIFEGARESAKKEREESRRALLEQIQSAKLIEEEANILLQAHRRLLPPTIVTDDAVETIVPTLPETDPRPELLEQTNAMDELVTRFHKLPILKLMRIDTFLLIQFMVALALAYPCFLLGMPLGPIVGGVVLVAEAIGLWLMFRSIAKKKVADVAAPLRSTMTNVNLLSERSKLWLDDFDKKRTVAIESKRDRELSSAAETLQSRTIEFTSRRDTEKARVEAHYPPLLAEAKQTATSSLAEIEARTEAELNDARARHSQGTEAADRIHQEGHQRERAQRDRDWNQLAQNWKHGMDAVRAEIAAIQGESSRLFPDWNVWTPETAAVETPPGLTFGNFLVEVDRIADAQPDDERLAVDAPVDFHLPAVFTWDERPSLLIRAGEEGRDEAVKVMQAAMIRLLTAFPPSKARFTIIDPVGLGQNFASFMHLADHDELLINHRIWTDSQQIDQRLADLTDHMENVIQTYLRNDYSTIADYNAQAGEVAEPYRFLVVANFPHGFTETSIRRLVSVAKSGARCGVYLLMSVDMDQPLPFGFTLKEIEPYANVLIWKEGSFTWRDARFEYYPLTVDSPPPVEAVGALLNQIGKSAKAARRVEVPFEVVAPKDDAWWTSSTTSGVEVPLGRAGATKLQYLSLGRGTSQHVLIAGKTGSGKSTFLHALITNVALRYSPDEIELYLIDFKKGVEFKTYANHQLPHARVVAVESEREFGLSVLQRLDQELKNRGELYRKVAAQDLAGYRAATGESLPRILLLVDEFQEFFVEDDKLAQECSLLLDRLVRQGRAFGIHVHLGSQTLSGAYSLARSTLGQMAVRIALQCSESDAHLILSEENTAARLLTRPGEAIYNDANGLVEGNHIFQIVWLGEDLREKYLVRLSQMAAERNLKPRVPMIVFEGNTPAELERNSFLNAITESPGWPEAKRSTSAWLGDAIAIKDPTAAVFQPQSGNHLLMIGQQEESALGIMTGIIAALAAQHEPGSARFVLFDGTPSDSPNANVLNDVLSALPHEVERGTTRSLPKIINDLAEEVDRRCQDDTLEPKPLYLFIHDLNRFRELRKKEDDFGFGSYGGDSSAPPSPSKQFVTLLREGPAVNVHVIVWCDTVNNLNRTFDRQGLSEFEMRVLFQMSSNDSSNLIDSPAAGKLGPNRAYFFSEEQGRLEKFRPYGLPTPEFLSALRSRLAAKPQPVPASPVIEQELLEDAV